MSRKLILFFLFIFCIQFCVTPTAKAQVKDTAVIFMPPYTDTTCFGTQLTFYAVPTHDTFHGVSYHWFTDGIFTGVVVDTFNTTALVNGDSVYCWVYFTNSLGVVDSYKTNTIIIYRVATLNANILIYLTAGNNPTCVAQPLTFTAYPINGGTNPIYQWFVNGVPLFDEDSTTITRYFSTGDTITCQLASNSPCAPYDTVMSGGIVIIQEKYFAGLSIKVLHDSICDNNLDTFIATATLPGNNPTYQWLVNNDTVVGAISPNFIIDSLHNGDSVFCIMQTHDTCVLNTQIFSNGIKIYVGHNINNSANFGITQGVNPGCLDSPVTLTAFYDSFGTAPKFTWYVNGVPVVGLDSFRYTNTFNDSDTVSVKIWETDKKCYIFDSITLGNIIMQRDTTPAAPLVSLISNLLEANTTGTFAWYGPTGLITGASGQVYHPTVRGYYYAIKTGDGTHVFNCPSLPSNIIYISLVGVNTIVVQHTKIYPDPTSGIVYMDWNGHQVDLDLAIYNMIGQEVLHEAIVGEMQHHTDLSRFPNGDYLMVFKDHDGNNYSYKVTLVK